MISYAKELYTTKLGRPYFEDCMFPDFEEYHFVVSSESLMNIMKYDSTVWFATVYPEPKQGLVDEIKLNKITLDPDRGETQESFMKIWNDESAVDRLIKLDIKLGEIFESLDEDPETHDSFDIIIGIRSESILRQKGINNIKDLFK